MTGRPSDLRGPVSVPSPRPPLDDRAALRVVARHGDADTVVSVSGELDVATAPTVLAAFDALSTTCAGRRSTGWTLRCDLSEVDFVSAAGVTALEAAHRTARQRGVALVIGACSRQVRRVLWLVESSLTPQPDGMDPGRPTGGAITHHRSPARWAARERDGAADRSQSR